MTQAERLLKDLEKFSKLIWDNNDALKYKEGLVALAGVEGYLEAVIEQEKHQEEAWAKKLT